MKDYYYFLGIEKEADSVEIKKAYRKLSLKYHPDKNDGDPFFEKRFLEIQEAYEVLISEESRKLYDGNQIKNDPIKSTLPPIIKKFIANTYEAKKGETITLEWQTIHSDIVKILPFGLEANYGERSFKITEFKNGKFLLVLHATNSFTRKTVVKGITITEKKDFGTEEIISNVEQLFTTKNPHYWNRFSPLRISRPLIIIYIIIAVIICGLFLIK